MSKTQSEPQEPKIYFVNAQVGEGYFYETIYKTMAEALKDRELGEDEYFETSVKDAKKRLNDHMHFECPSCHIFWSEDTLPKKAHDCQGDEQDQKISTARDQIQILLATDVSKQIQDLLHATHTESNCQCDGVETQTMISEGAGDIEICIKCFGAKGCVY